jgi:hypothetical protein
MMGESLSINGLGHQMQVEDVRCLVPTHAIIEYSMRGRKMPVFCNREREKMFERSYLHLRVYDRYVKLPFDS